MENKNDKKAYNILVIGANGGIGRQVVEIALRAGHRVTAVLRTPDKLPVAHSALEKVKGDVTQPESYEKYLKDKDIVISAIGVSGGLFSDKPTTLYSEGAANILQVMKKNDVKRVFFISASAVEISPVLPFFVKLVAKYIIQRLLKHMYADIRLMESIVKKSDAKWTIIRPPLLIDKPLTGHYRFAISQFLKNCLTISRADVAHFMLNNIDNEATYKAVVEIAY